MEYPVTHHNAHQPPAWHSNGCTKGQGNCQHMEWIPGGRESIGWVYNGVFNNKGSKGFSARRASEKTRPPSQGSNPRSWHARACSNKAILGYVCSRSIEMDIDNLTDKRLRESQGRKIIGKKEKISPNQSAHLQNPKKRTEKALRR